MRAHVSAQTPPPPLACLQFEYTQLSNMQIYRLCEGALKCVVNCIGTFVGQLKHVQPHTVLVPFVCTSQMHINHKWIPQKSIYFWTTSNSYWAAVWCKTAERSQRCQQMRVLPVYGASGLWWVHLRSGNKLDLLHYTINFGTNTRTLLLL